MAKSMGIESVKIISATSIETAPWVVLKCKYGCDKYNSSKYCPPNTPSYKETREIINCYNYALLIKCTSRSSLSKNILELEKSMSNDWYYKAFAIGVGSCKICKACKSTKCANQEKVRPSMEACGIDIVSTMKANGYNISIENKGNNDNEDCYGLILIE